MKRMICLVVIMMLTAVPAAVYAAKDEPSGWAKQEVESAIAAGIVPPDMQRDYSGDIPRAEFARLAIHFLSVKLEKTAEELVADKGKQAMSDAFSDTDDSAILAAHALGIVSGKGEGLFKPDELITRQEAAVMLYRTAKLFGMKAGDRVYRFADGHEVAGWAGEAVGFVYSTSDRMNDARVMGGVSEDRFEPNGRYTRQQAYITFKRLGNAMVDYHPDQLPDALTDKERELADLINDYRISLGLEPMRISKSLTKVARYHVYDSNAHRPEDGVDARGMEANLHSWSDQGLWKAVAYTPDHEYAELMWSKPSELTDYPDSGFEISAAQYGAAMTPQLALDLWKGSPGHNSVIAGEGYWSGLNVIGVGIHGGYSHVWFGIEEDPAGYYSE
ncbi:S-layer homology domain-containing protein [Paenibacillus sp. J5C_2022]|uniref:CAP and S-layer homology domain-containing protein n=1 Tax=Paenibacillus sp. J5C2022 TaxID=2977129 RepID=UPI0021D0A1DE|nr:S-layer homology domain-containing protein [Paenibacillus sp. J5C2022]MCU6711402.1 S-layer homology domain-containing protein [Paenibacillus sp. J5C2022]